MWESIEPTQDWIDGHITEVSAAFAVYNTE